MLGVVGTAMRIQAEGNDIATTKVNFCRDINGTVTQAFLLTTTLQHRYTEPPSPDRAPPALEPTNGSKTLESASLSRLPPLSLTASTR